MMHSPWIIKLFCSDCLIYNFNFSDVKYELDIEQMQVLKHLPTTLAEALKRSFDTQALHGCVVR